ncbi:hypothetical protein [Nannocystis sp. SCPEA4]|uniref:hypothetical protein n=1 Tax=Nannocystis sp. SCPEA4 TaxID=2996787 RepID=UPI00226E5D07|nr:hypothetical protein [Nannocystis sp. SCPEA4]MCY1062817.1 hypothetical protein [Nannocystis sp. SCPEA4]
MSSAQDPDEAYHEVVQAVARPRIDSATRAQLDVLGLHLLHVTWEDTARYKGSMVGPNISDMTIQVQSRSRGRPWLTCMPVIRFPNFADRTGDLPIDVVRLHVGNERGEPLRTIGLRDYLADLRAHLTRPDGWAGDVGSLLAPRDTHVLVSPQACLLPVPHAGLATFTPVIFNYQSRRRDPAVLAILATREGTSATVVDNHRDAFTVAGALGQRLLFNQAGQRAPFTATRASEHMSSGTGSHGPAAASAVLLIQVPLRQFGPTLDWMVMEQERGISVVEPAIIGHGDVEGPFTEIDDLPLVRDERFPIRVTVQFYKATSDGQLDEDVLVDIGAQLERVLADATAVGSLVDAGETGRVTEWDDGGAGKRQPPGWWGAFWRRYAAENGLPLAEALEQWFRRQAAYPSTPDDVLRDIADMSPKP